MREHRPGMLKVADIRPHRLPSTVPSDSCVGRTLVAPRPHCSMKCGSKNLVV
jgi:hypothetical protein